MGVASRPPSSPRNLRPPETLLPSLNALQHLLAPIKLQQGTPREPADPTPPRRRLEAVMPSSAAAWNPPRARIQLRLAIQRVRLLAQKRTQLAKSTRREVAALLERGKVESAKIKVEGLLSEDLYVELLEVLELCVLSARLRIRRGAD